VPTSRPCVAALHRDCTPLLHGLLAARTSMAYIPGEARRRPALSSAVLHCSCDVPQIDEPVRPVSRNAKRMYGGEDASVAAHDVSPSLCGEPRYDLPQLAFSEDAKLPGISARGRSAQEAIDRCSLFAAAGGRSRRAHVDGRRGWVCMPQIAPLIARGARAAPEEAAHAAGPGAIGKEAADPISLTLGERR
jgi:hypothetical protein